MNNKENVANTKKLNHLFQSSSDLYYHFADFRPSKDMKQVKELDRGISWVIFDANSSKNNFEMFSLLQKVSEVVSTLNEHRVVNQFLGFSRRLRFFYEVNMLSLFDPKSVAENNLIYMKESIVSLKEQAEMWFRQQAEVNTFYWDIYPVMEPLLEQIVFPFIKATS